MEKYKKVVVSIFNLRFEFANILLYSLLTFSICIDQPLCISKILIKINVSKNLLHKKQTFIFYNICKL